MMKENNVSKKHYLEVVEKFHLTSREKELGYLKVSGYTNARIAETYGISVLTVKKHCTHLYEKAWVPGHKEFSELF